jgi:hypothetical protein
MRCAEHLGVIGAPVPDGVPALDQAADGLALIEAGLAREDGLIIADVREEIQSRMSDNAGFICQVDELPAARDAAQALRRRIVDGALKAARPSQAVDLFRWRHLALLSEAVLEALVSYVADGGGSRGARAYCAPDGEVVFESRHGPVDRYRYRREQSEHQGHKLTLHWTGSEFTVSKAPLRETEDFGRIFFEKNWAGYLTGSIHTEGFSHQ